MGSSQSTPNETDTTEVLLESDDDGEVKISKRHLSREELDNLSAELEQNISDKNVTIDMDLYKSIGADLGYEFDDEEEEEDEYYDEGEVEAYELVEPIETPDNFSMVPGINQMGSVDALDLGPPLFTELTPPVDNTPTHTKETQNIDDNLVVSNEDNRVSEKNDTYMDDPLSDTSTDTELSESDLSTSYTDSDDEISGTDLTTEDLSEEITNVMSPSNDTELTTESNISLEVDESESPDTPVEDIRLESVDLSADESEPDVSSTVDTETLSDTSSKSEVATIDTVPGDSPNTSASIDLEISQELSSEETITQEMSSEETSALEMSSEITVSQEVSLEETVLQEVSTEETSATDEVAPVDLSVIPVEDSIIVSENISEDLAVDPKEPAVKEAPEVILLDADEPSSGVPTQEIPVPEECTIEQKPDLMSPEVQSAVEVTPISTDTERIEEESLETAEEPISGSDPASPLISAVSDVKSSETVDDIAVADSVDETSTLGETLVQVESVGDVAEDEVFNKDLGTLENVEYENTAVQDEVPTSEPFPESSLVQDLTDNVVQEETTTEPASTPLSAVEAEPQDSIETVEEAEPEVTYENLHSQEVEVEKEQPTIAVMPVTEELEIISESLSPEEPVITEPAIPETVLPGPVSVDHALLEPVVPLSSVEEPDASVDVAPPVIEEVQVLVVTEEISSSEEKVVSVEQDVESEIVHEELSAEDVVVDLVEQTEETTENAEDSVPLIASEPEEDVSDIVESLPEPIETVSEPLESTSQHFEAASELIESPQVPIDTSEPEAAPQHVEKEVKSVEISEAASQNIEKEVESVEIATLSVGTSTESLEAVTEVEESAPETVTESESAPAISESAGGLFGLIQKAIEPYFASIKEETIREESPQVSSEETTPTLDNISEQLTPVEETLPQTTTNTDISPVVEVAVEPVVEQVAETVEPVVEQVAETVKPVVEQVAETVEPVVESVVEPVIEPAAEPLTEPTAEVNELPKSESLAQSLFGEYKKQEVEKIITEAKVEGARNQARIDADVMSNALNTERSRWRGRFSVIESNLNKRKQDISSAHEEGFALVTSKLQIPETKETCSDSASEIVDCYLANPDKVLRCNQIAQSFDSCVNKALSSR